MFDLITLLFSSESFIPHGHCFLWRTPLVWLHVVSDSVIALAYYSIPVTLFHFVQRRKDLPFNWVFVLFAAFITACGTSHLMSIWTLWHPTYWLAGGVKAITALVSLSTAIALFPLMPKALAIPSLAELEAANQALHQEIADRKRIEAEREQAEQALKLSEARYRAIVEDQTELIARFLPDSTMLFANEAYCRYFGLQPAEVIGKSYAPVIFEQDQDTVAQLVQSMSAENPTVTIENRVVVGGEVRWTQWMNRAFFDRQGCLREIQAVGRDIHALKQVEAALRESNQRFTTLAETAPVAIFRFDADGNCSYVNNRWCEMTGRPLEMGMGTEWLQTIHPEDRDRTINAWSRWVESHQPGEFFQNEARILRPDGSILWYYCQITSETDSSGALIGYIGTLTNINDRKRAEEQLQSSLKEKEVLLKEMHHRVKNNLQIVYSLLRLQRRKLKDQLSANALIESQSRIEAIALIHEKLYQSEDLAQINLAEYIPSLITNLFSTYNVNHTQIELKTEIESAFLDIDKAIRCGLIINELLSNSLKYAFPASMQSKPCIYINFRKSKNHTFSLIVEDNGIGVPRHINLLHLETLGLQLVQGFVQQLKGTLQPNCQSGTAFHILFPGEDL